MQTGILWRYSCTKPEESEVALFEREVAEYVGSEFALAVNSCASAMYISLQAVGVKPGDKVLSNAFTYTAVPSAIINAGATPVLVEVTSNYCLDTEDLRKKITPDTKVLLLSHMRGHVSDMAEITKICEEQGLILIEDCAHSLGATYDGVHTGRFGIAGCISTQSHKMINSGEGGILITDDEELIAKAILYAGSQQTFWQRHFITPKIEDYLKTYQEYIPNISLRMSNLAAAVLRPQLQMVEEMVETYSGNYETMAALLSKSEHIRVPEPFPEVRRGPDTIQFNLENFSLQDVDAFIERMRLEGVKVKFFGAKGNPRYFKSWKYITNIENVHLPHTESLLPFTCDLRLPLHLTTADVLLLGETLLDVIDQITQKRALQPA